MGKTILNTCAISGITTGQVENDLPASEQDEDPGVPVGWLEVRVRRVVANPDHADFMARRGELIEAAKATVGQQAMQAGQAPTPEQLTEAATDMVDMQMGEPPASCVLESIGPAETPEGEEGVFFIHPDHAASLAKVGGEFAETFASFGVKAEAAAPAPAVP